MGQNDHLFMYVDKSKILPWIENELKTYPDPSEEELIIKQTATFAYRQALLKIKEGIEHGLWDWQQGS